ncbi:unnamed protein product [Allacma fusca]|uniref:Uncharacterized protein n=1 Tax=Allacma fusca TaxID=39272 RepID=A0A8J2JZD1_9HEXA|nr:unnamed protein product [Allacma fusca]
MMAKQARNPYFGYYYRIAACIHRFWCKRVKQSEKLKLLEHHLLQLERISTFQFSGIHSVLLEYEISGSSACGAEIPLEQRDLINNLVNLLIHNGIKCFSLMSTCAIAFILLNKYRTRVSMEKLLEEMIELKNELIRRKR